MILFVDDNAGSRQAFTKIIRLHGHEVMEAANATEALKILDSFQLELVITDFVMPNISGFQLIRAHSAKVARYADTLDVGIPFTGNSQSHFRMEWSGIYSQAY